MAAVDPGYAEWLRTGTLYTSVSDGTIAAAWTTLAIETEILSPLATKAGADVEAARQLAFLAGPLVEDVALIPGLRADLIGQAITLRFGGLGYDAGKVVFVVGAEESEATLTTTLNILRKLA